MYTPHPSAELQRLFEHSPYQGAAPEEATFLFVGLDANYDAGIESQPIFQRIVEYHADGVEFWRRRGIHHPFLLSDYRGDGRLYHQTFARIGFTPAHAHLVSFIELLDRPTVGRNALTPDDLDVRHLERINAAIWSGRSRHIFISSAVARLMRSTRHFAWMPLSPSGAGPLRVWRREGDRSVYAHLHFSMYGKFERQKTAELAAIGGLVDPR